MSHILREEMLSSFHSHLIEEEKSKETISKYMRDVCGFVQFVGLEKEVTKEQVILYKQNLMERYAPASVNSMLAAVNHFLGGLEWYDCMVKAIKIQHDAFRPKERELSKEEYLRLLEAARKNHKDRLCLLMETLCATGIRVSELPFITVEAVREGWATVSLKGKTRRVFLPKRLKKKLTAYARKRGLQRGSIFVTRSGKAMDRSNILHEMKALCEEAGVDRKKVFPHNLRHLFACIFYKTQKDISHLADILGHSNINTTRIYTRISGEEHARQMDRLGLLL